jgi:hypothetical protein
MQQFRHIEGGAGFLRMLASLGKRSESSRMRATPFLTVLLAIPLMSLPAASEDGKKRLVFPTASEPSPKNPATPSTPAARVLEPTEVLKQFFEDLKADQLDSAYQGLVKNTIISERTENIDQLKEKTRLALDNFGPVKGFEIVESLDVGSALIRFTCVSLNADVPMRWRFYFYRSGSQWKIIDLRVDDGIADLFEEVSSRRKK